MDYRTVDIEDYNNIIRFLQLEAEMDKENWIEMTRIEPSHLTKTKINEIEKLGSKYKRESNSLIKNYKETFKKTKRHERETVFGIKRDWLRRRLDLNKIRDYSKEEIKNILKREIKLRSEKWTTI